VGGAEETGVYRGGTHRACAPEETLERVLPHLETLGVTRIADLTGLDRVGIPVFAAIRPRGRILQTTNGKGLRAVDARVSAIMEAVEHWHCESRPGGLVRARAGDLPGAVGPDRLPRYVGSPDEGADRELEWLPAIDLFDAQTPGWIPASAVLETSEPRVFDFSTNGIATGNTTTEATLHALYEVIERDVVTRCIQRGFTLRPPHAERVRPETVDDERLRTLFDRVRAAGLDIALIRLHALNDLPVFWAALLDPNPFHPCTRVNFGYGVHLSPVVAAIRAITEAAQARLSFIHGVREDLRQRILAATDAAISPVFDYFRGLEPVLDWPTLRDQSSDDLETDLDALLDWLRASGSTDVYRVDLTRRDPGLPVVKVVAPGREIDRRFF
jgi:ribosomal protein S12 methylthiotransferase accessory factor